MVTIPGVWEVTSEGFTGYPHPNPERRIKWGGGGEKYNEGLSMSDGQGPGRRGLHTSDYWVWMWIASEPLTSYFPHSGNCNRSRCLSW